jgi:hypothetical protein
LFPRIHNCSLCHLLGFLFAHIGFVQTSSVPLSSCIELAFEQLIFWNI